MTNVLIKKIRTDGGTQSRAFIDQTTVDEYTEAYGRGDKLPPVVVFYDGTDYWLSDGFHRLQAQAKLGIAEIECNVLQGDLRSAVLFSVGANATHGLRRTNKDKRRAVERLITDPEWSAWSNYAIAQQCAVSEFLVRTMRDTLTAINRSENRSFTNKHGNTSVMQTAKIGKGKYERYLARVNKEDASIPIPEILPALSPNAPQYLHDAIDAKQIAVTQAIAVWEALRQVSEPVSVACIESQVIDPQAIALLEAKKHTETAISTMTTGYLQTDNEDQTKPLSEATAWDLQGVLRKAEKEHRRAGIDAKIQSQLGKIELASSDVYSVIYADPPWQYDNSGLHGSAERHYPTMTTNRIECVLHDIGLQVAENAVLFLWATNPLLIDALQVIQTWGFTYKTNIAWVKDNPTTGLGFYVKGQHELLLIATRGSFLPNFKYPSVLTANKGAHSEKPHAVYSLIETMYPNQHYIELFSRVANNNERTSWSYWGAEYDAV